MERSDFRARLERLPILKGPAAVLLRRLEGVDLDSIGEEELVAHCRTAKVGEFDARLVVGAFRVWRGVRWAPGLTGVYTTAEVAHRISCPSRVCAACEEMANRTAVDPEIRHRVAFVAQQIVAVLP